MPLLAPTPKVQAYVEEAMVDEPNPKVLVQVQAWPQADLT